jgi:Fe-S cluster assembly ATP-binding protein
VEGGSVDWLGQDLLEMKIEDRARSGLFLAFQYPIEIPGVSNAYFLRASVNAVRRHQGLT